MTNQFSAEAKTICHQVGMLSLLPLIQRTLDAEGAVQQLISRVTELEKRISELESAAVPPHQRHVEKREV